MPFKELPGLQRPLYAEIARRDADLYEACRSALLLTGRAGFRHDMGEDAPACTRFICAGYYIDVGASQMIIDGRIRLKHCSVAELGERTVVLSDGTTLPADLVVFATGYGNMSQWAAKLISPEVAARVGSSPSGVGPNAVGGRAAQHVEAYGAAGAMVSRGKFDAVAALFAVSRLAAHGQVHSAKLNLKSNLERAHVGPDGGSCEKVRRENH